MLIQQESMLKGQNQKEGAVKIRPYEQKEGTDVKKKKHFHTRNRIKEVADESESDEFSRMNTCNHPITEQDYV